MELSPQKAAFSPFVLDIRVYYEDTDAGGIVYYANYLKFSERARTEWLRTMNVSQQSLLEQKQGFVIRDIKAVYHKSARLDDILHVSCIPIRARFASLTFYQQVKNDLGVLLFELECNIAYVNHLTGRPMAMPKEALEFARARIPADLTLYGVKI